MDNYPFLLSIAIPTKDRYDTLFPILDYLCTLNNDLVEIVIQDNTFDNSEIKQKLKSTGTLRNIKYHHSDQKLSVIENFDQAIIHCSGEFICSIGDDDAVMPYIINIVKWMKNNKILSMNGYKPTYFWPNQKTSYLSSNDSGSLKFKNWDNKIIKLKIDTMLNNIISKGGTIMDNIPSVYHGIIHSSILKEIYSASGTHFPGPSPDMANAIALTKFIDEHTFANLPIFISGKSIKSTGGQGIIHEHVASIKDVSHLPDNTASEWDPRIPKYWTGPTIWAETILKVIEKLNLGHLKINFNFKYLYAYILTYNFKHRKVIFKNFKITLYDQLICSYYVFVIFINRCINFISNRNPLIVKEVTNVESVTKAIEHISKIVKPNTLRNYDL